VSTGQTPNAAKFRCAPTRSVQDIRCRKLLLPGKVNQNSPKSLEICYATLALVVLYFIALGQTVYEKSVTIFHTLQYSGAPGGPLGQSSQSCPWCMQQQVPIYQSSKFRRFQRRRDRQKYAHKSASVTDWLMPPHGITGPPEQSSPKSGNKCRWPDPANFVALQQEVCEIIHCRKFVLQEKWTKIHRNRRWFTRHKCRLSRQISSLSAKRCKRKALHFLHPSVFWCSRGPPGPKFTSLSPDVGLQHGPLYQPAKCRPVLKPLLYVISAKIFANFVDGVTDKNSKRYVSARIPRRDEKAHCRQLLL